MIGTIQRFFDRRIQKAMERPETSEHALRLATAALLVEMSRADFHVDAAEEEALAASLERYFSLTGAEARELMALAAREVKEAASLYQFTSLIDRHFSHDQKRQVLEMLWRVAYADGHKDKYEEHLVRKVADLIHLSHRDFIQTRLRVEEERARGA